MIELLKTHVGILRFHLILAAVHVESSIKGCNPSSHSLHTQVPPKDLIVVGEDVDRTPMMWIVGMDIIGSLGWEGIRGANPTINLLIRIATRKVFSGHDQCRCTDFETHSI
jgi:hypothetical protein